MSRGTPQILPDPPERTRRGIPPSCTCGVCQRCKKNKRYRRWYHFGGGAPSDEELDRKALESMSRSQEA